MARIKMEQVEGIGRTALDKAIAEFMRHCRLRNLSPETLKYYEEDLIYFKKCIPIQYADEICRERLEELIIHEMDKGNRITAINARVRGLRVFFRFCAEREYAEGFKFPLLKEDETMKEPYTDAELKKLLARPNNSKWAEWRTWAIINTFLATGIRASTLLNIRVADVDFEQSMVLLKKLKNRKQQYVPLSQSLKTALANALLIC